MSIRATLQSEAKDPVDTLPQLPDDIKYANTGGPISNKLIKSTTAIKHVKKSLSTVRAGSESLPDTFDWRDQRGSDGLPLLTAVQDQGNCGCCYAFSSVDAFASRISILTNGKFRPALAVQDMINCGSSFVQDVLSDPESFEKYKIASAGNYILDGCNGGLLTAAVDYILVKGVPLASDLPYSSYDGISTDSTACANTQSTLPRFYAQDAYAVVAGGEDDGFSDSSIVSAQKSALNVDDIKRDVIKNGPVVTGIEAFDDFLVYPTDNSSLVYRPSSTFTVNNITYKNKLDGFHAVQIVGWTQMADSTGTKVPVWIVKNQWTSNWGNNGYAYVPLGKNVISIESDVLANTPSSPGPTASPSTPVQQVKQITPQDTQQTASPSTISPSPVANTSLLSTATPSTTTTTSNNRMIYIVVVVVVVVATAAIIGLVLGRRHKKNVMLAA